MEVHNKPHVVGADRLAGSVIITFEDGRCGLYSSALLFAMLPQAQELLQPDDPIEVEETEGQDNLA